MEPRAQGSKANFMDDRFDALFNPLAIGPEVARNRLGMAPVSSGLVNDRGCTTEDFRRFHELYAAAGLGTVFVGGVAVTSAGRPSVRSFVLDDAEKAGDVAETIARIRHCGAVPIIQLMHSGRQTRIRSVVPPLAASALPCPVTGVTPKEMTKAEIERCISDFREAAEYAILAGARVVEVHAAHGYLLAGYSVAVFGTRRRLSMAAARTNGFDYLVKCLRSLLRYAALRSASELARMNLFREG